MKRGIYAHRNLIGIFAGDTFVHVEQITVAFGNNAFPQAVDGIGKIKINPDFGFTDTATFITGFFRRTGRNITRGKITEAGVFTFKELITLIFGDIRSCPIIAGFLWDPDTTIIAERFGH